MFHWPLFQVSRPSIILHAPPAPRGVMRLNWVLASFLPVCTKSMLPCFVASRSEFNSLVAGRTLLHWVMELQSPVFGSFVPYIDISSLFRTCLMLKPHLNLALRRCFMKIHHKVIAFLPLTSSLMLLFPAAIWRQEHVMNRVPVRHLCSGLYNPLNGLFIWFMP